MNRILILMQLVAVAAYAAGPPLNDFASPFDGKDCEVIWQAATNYPTVVKVFAVVPTKFGDETVSNLLEMAELKPHQRKRVDQSGVFAGADVRFFADRKETRQVNLIPSQGFIVLNRDGTEARIPKEKPVSVPTDKEAFNLATNFLRRLGYEPSQLVPMLGGECAPSSSEAIVLSKDKGSGQMATNIVSRTIHLCRQLDGIPVTGGAGVEMKFGNEGKLGHLSIVWRSVKPERDYPVPNAGGFISRIKSGRTLIYETQAGKPYRKFTIKKVLLYYWESEGSQFQTTIYPFAVLEAETDLPAEDSKARLFVQFASE
jgi:hypothetical protein